MRTAPITGTRARKSVRRVARHADPAHAGGTFVLRPGDVIAFPTGAAGAHRLSNESDASCDRLLFANTDEGDACFYPDSRKLLVEQTGTLVRSEPELDYFDGE